MARKNKRGRHRGLEILRNSGSRWGKTNSYIKAGDATAQDEKKVPPFSGSQRGYSNKAENQRPRRHQQCSAFKSRVLNSWAGGNRPPLLRGAGDGWSSARWVRLENSCPMPSVWERLQEQRWTPRSCSADLEVTLDCTPHGRWAQTPGRITRRPPTPRAKPPRLGAVASADVACEEAQP